ncbi:hypothetical protein AN958_07402 [Leucoagaricus sp. SymC.cos]|nr:hypothetical protein AN958_07402 [Leucoagaricus sp. SymC.cos]
MSYPDTPRNYTVPLPTTPIRTSQSITQIFHGMFPISLDNITISQQIELENVILTTPIHVHTHITHVGLIYGTFPGQALTALDTVMFKATFMQRNSAALDVVVTWDDFMAGRNVGNRPVGHDLLLGATEVWGVESVSFGGFSAIHLA